MSNTGAETASLELVCTKFSCIMKEASVRGTDGTSYRRAPRASVKLFELGVRTPGGGLFLGVRYAGVSIFGVFVPQAFPFSAQI